jgi:hypothetical protein
VTRYTRLSQASACRELRDTLDKYLKSPGTLSISKSLHDIYKLLDVDSLKDAGDESYAGIKSDLDMHESEPEPVTCHLREHIIKMDNQPFDFVPISQNVIYW